MFASFRLLSRACAVLTLAGTTLTLAACNNSSTSTTAATPTATPPARGAACTAGATAVTATVTIQTGTVSIPAVGGCSATIAFPSVAAPVTATVTSQLTAPAGYPTSVPAPTGFSGSATPVMYFTFKPNAAVTITGNPTLVFTVPAAPVAGSFFNLTADLGPVATGGIGGGTVGYGGPGTISGAIITFTPSGGGGSGGSQTLLANETYVISLNFF